MHEVSKLNEVSKEAKNIAHIIVQNGGERNMITSWVDVTQNPMMEFKTSTKATWGRRSKIAES